MPPEQRPPIGPDPGGSPGPEPPPWEAFDEPASPKRGRRLLVLAAIPWAVVALLMLRTAVADAPPTRVPAPSPDPAVAGVPSPQTAAPPAEADPIREAAAPEGPTAVRFGVRVSPGPADVAATAVLVARSWLGGVGPEPRVDVGAAPGPPVYVEHLAVEAVDLPSSDTAVATVVAIVLETTDDRYTSARAVRLAVPIAVDRTGTHPAGEPWWLPAPDLASRALAWTPIEDPELLSRAGAALEAVGYRGVSVIDLATSTAWPLRVTAEAVAPGTDGPDEHVVWLRDHLGDLVVAGALPPTRSPAQRATPQEGSR